MTVGITWSYSTSPGNRDILGRVFDLSGKPVEISGSTNPFAIESDVSDDREGSAAGLAGGRIVAAWTDGESDFEGDSIHAKVLQISNVWQGGEDDDVITGDALRDVMNGGAGDDILSGGGGPDLLRGGDGNDTMEGGVGVNRMHGGTGDDSYIVYADTDKIIEKDGQGIQDKALAWLSYSLTSMASIEVLRAFAPESASNLELRGNGFVQKITGNAGHNILADGGGAGADTLVGLGGADTYIIENAGTKIVESSKFAGDDVVRAGVSYALEADDSIEWMFCLDYNGTTPVNLTGNKFFQRITGNNGANELSDGGGAGADELSGRGGNDVYVVGNAATLIVEDRRYGVLDAVLASVSFALAANDFIESLAAASPSDTASINLSGNRQSQAITGNAGANIITGGGGKDVLTGGGDGDTFAFASAKDSRTGGASDLITDFSLAEGDVIDLFAMDANSGIVGNQAFAFLGEGAFSNVAGQLLLQRGAITSVLGDTNGDGAADFQIDLAGDLALTAAEFIL